MGIIKVRVLDLALSVDYNSKKPRVCDSAVSFIWTGVIVGVNFGSLASSVLLIMGNRWSRRFLYCGSKHVHIELLIDCNKKIKLWQIVSNALVFIVHSIKQYYYVVSGEPTLTSIYNFQAFAHLYGINAKITWKFIEPLSIRIIFILLFTVWHVSFSL